MYIFLSWIDPRAPGEVAKATNETTAPGGRDCARECVSIFFFLSLSFLYRVVSAAHFVSFSSINEKHTGLCVGQRAPSEQSQCCDSMWLPSFV